MDNTNFYQMKMSDRIYAFTIYDSSVFYNKKYIDIANNKEDKKNLSALAINDKI